METKVMISEQESKPVQTCKMCKQEIIDEERMQKWHGESYCDHSCVDGAKERADFEW